MYKEKLKNLLLKKLKEREVRYKAWGISLYVSTKFVQIKALWGR
jgi:hypothetical protein